MQQASQALLFPQCGPQVHEITVDGLYFKLRRVIFQLNSLQQTSVTKHDNYSL